MIVTMKKYKELKKAHGDAVKGKLDKFKYEGEFMVTDYAKYLIEHIENELARDEPKPWHG